jgi:CHAT domain-containing protein
VLASHWAVPSKETAALTTAMMATLYRGGAPVSRSAALHAAQLKIAGNPKTAHPFYWAGFTLIGDGGA